MPTTSFDRLQSLNRQAYTGCRPMTAGVIDRPLKAPLNKSPHHRLVILLMVGRWAQIKYVIRIPAKGCITSRHTPVMKRRGRPLLLTLSLCVAARTERSLITAPRETVSIVCSCTTTAAVVVWKPPSLFLCT